MSRTDKFARSIKELAAQFLERESNRTSLLTVTGCSVSPDLKRATIFLTVFPEEKEKAALGFAKRQRSALRKTLKQKLRVKIIPFLEIEIDKGEKNRQKIDELLREK